MTNLTKTKAIQIAYQHFNQYYYSPKTPYISGSDAVLWHYRVFAHCGAKEVLKIIKNLDDVRFILDSLQSFVECCLDAACESTTDEQNLLFSTYADVATDFMDLFI